MSCSFKLQAYSGKCYDVLITLHAVHPILTSLKLMW